MNFAEEYRRSLKMPEAEEILDLIIYRPIAYLFVKGVYRLPISPNQVTMISMLLGFVASWMFSLSTPGALMWAGILFAVANVLDCADGQLARLQKSGTLLGRVVDGVADYASSVAIFIGIGISLVATGNPSWMLVVLAALSSATHALFFDHYQSEFISIVRAERNFLDREIDQFTHEVEQLRGQRRSIVKVRILSWYVRYLFLQKKASTREEQKISEPEIYRKANKKMIRRWSFLGPTTNRTILIVCALIGRIEIYLWVIVLFGNVWLLISYQAQRQIHRKLSVAADRQQLSGIL